MKKILIILFLLIGPFLIWAQSPQYSTGDYAASITITVDTSKVAGSTDLADFPMLVDITDPALRNSANGGYMEHANGYDILFSGDCGAALHHDIESYVEASGRLIVWVRIPVLYANQNTEIKL